MFKYRLCRLYRLYPSMILLCLFSIFTIGCSKQNIPKTNTQTNVNEYLILVNKEHPLNNDYIPNNLVKVENVDYIQRENETMLINEETFYYYMLLYKDALKNDLDLTIFSAYRSYEKQNKIWQNNPNENYVARPGQSEHQTGLAIDISRRDIGLTSNFMFTNEYLYLKNNAHRFGFINRYPMDKEIITGYLFEPWHYRFVGVDIATEIYLNNITLEEYLA